jgi:hypothetical protein
MEFDYKYKAKEDALLSIQFYLDEDGINMLVTSNMTDETDKLFDKYNAAIFGVELTESKLLKDIQPFMAKIGNHLASLEDNRRKES